MIEHRQLRFFIVAAQYMNITKAAKALFLTQPALTRNIHQIEEELGVPLFRRAHRRISLTEAGECFLAEAKLTLQQLDHSITAAQKASRGELGKLIIGCTSMAGLVGVPRLVQRFRERFPGPMIVLQELDSAGLEPALRRGTIDVALLYGSLTGEDYGVKLLREDRFMIAVPQNHRLAKQRRVKLLDFANETFIMPRYSVGDTATSEILAECHRAGFHPQSTQSILATSAQSSLGLVSVGIGVLLIPSALRPFSRKGVVFRAIGKTSVSLRLNLQWRRQDESVVLRNLLATVGVFPQEPRFNVKPASTGTSAVGETKWARDHKKGRKNRQPEVVGMNG